MSGANHATLRAGRAPIDLTSLVKIAGVNIELAKLHGTRNITYMDIGKVFMEADGSIAAEVMNDYLHPTGAGYERWGEAMAPTLKKLLDLTA